MLKDWFFRTYLEELVRHLTANKCANMYKTINDYSDEALIFIFVYIENSSRIRQNISN